jgi:hypothetical protein
LKIIATILERPVIEKILKHLGLQPQPPPKAPARELVPASRWLSRACRQTRTPQAAATDRQSWLARQRRDRAARRVGTTLSTSG